jgi:hypothetical protein
MAQYGGQAYRFCGQGGQKDLKNKQMKTSHSTFSLWEKWGK